MTVCVWLLQSSGAVGVPMFCSLVIVHPFALFVGSLPVPYLWVPYQQVAFSIKNQQVLPYRFPWFCDRFPSFCHVKMPQFTPSRAVAEATVAPKWQLPGRGEAQVWQAPPQ